MRFAIDRDSSTPVFRQLEDQIRYAVSVGELRPGDRLPSIRRLEAQLGLNRNTARRAYLELEREGTLIVRQGRTAEVASPPRWAERRPPPAMADDLAREIVRSIESLGIDGLGFLSPLHRAAAEHDARHPKCVLVECSRLQAEDFARAAGEAWGRRVVGLDLRSLREKPGAIPPSAKHVVTTCWHAAEVVKILAGRPLSVHEVTVRPSAALREGIRRLSGLRTALIVRDEESIPGYRQLVGKLVRVKGPVRVAVMGDDAAVERLLEDAEAIVFTTPCRDYVRDRAGPGFLLQELIYEPTRRSLDRLREEIFAVSESREAPRAAAGRA
jgi:GntR family transcriptional regulator